MNEDQLKILLIHFNLGTAKTPAQRIYGGLLHKMWRVETEKGVYAMHNLDLNIPEISEPTFELHSDDKIMLLAESSSNKSGELSSKLNESLGGLLGANQKYHSSIDVMKEKTVVSHGDLDQKNVLWDSENNPILIDWESARKLNQTYEIVNVALDWPGINDNFNIEIFRKMIELYKHAGTVIDDEGFEAAFYGVSGNQINWLVYIINRACNNKDPEQQVIGAEQVSQVLPAILRLQQLIPELLNGDIL